MLVNIPCDYRNGRSLNQPTALDLFCGAGGLSLGFCQAGGRPVGAVDNDKDSISTYKRMFPHVKNVHCGDIERWRPNLEKQRIDVIIGGPPCQGFSLARGFRFVDDPRNHLYKYFVRIVKKFRPQWIVMENVPGITSIGKGCILEQIMEDFRSIGYNLDCRVINMADFGVPQTRRRAIFVGNCLGIAFSWPEPTHTQREKSGQLAFNFVRPYVSVGDALGDLPWPLGKYIAHRANSKMRGPRNRDLWKDPCYTLRVRGDEFGIRNTPAEGVFAAEVLDESLSFYGPTQNDYQRYMREQLPKWFKKPPQTPPEVNTPPETLIEPRRLTVREQARLQSFPDWFFFEGTPYSQGRQVGNAVPPLFARSLFVEIFKQLHNT